jgi:hypothetical protein
MTPSFPQYTPLRLEIQQADIGTTTTRPHGPVGEQMMRRFYGPPK